MKCKHGNLYGADVSKTSDNEILNEAKTGSERLIKDLSGEWWLTLEPEVAGLLGSLFHHLATGLKNTKKLEKLGTVEQVLDKLSSWAEEKASNCPSTAKIKAVQQKIATAEVPSLSDKETSGKGERVKAKTKSIDEERVGRSIEALKEQLTKNTGHLEQLTLILRDSMSQVIQQQELRARNLEGQLSDALNLKLQPIQELGVQVQSTLNSLSPNLDQRLGSVDSNLRSILEKMSDRIHIRDAIQILEIKQEVERFVEADLIKKISLQVMPAIAVLKNAQGNELTSAVADLDIRCLAAGLIPVERLFA
jgi:hypothetical protein